MERTKQAGLRQLPPPRSVPPHLQPNSYLVFSNDDGDGGGGGGGGGDTGYDVLSPVAPEILRR